MLIIVAPMLLAGVAACGDPGEADVARTRSPDEPASSAEAADATPTDDGDGSDLDPVQVLEEYAACMGHHGVELPGLTGGSERVEGQVVEDGQVYALADAACSPILDGLRRQFELDPDAAAEIADQQLAFARCMRDEGVSSFPDPQPGIGVAFEQLGVDRATFDLAFAACSETVYGGDLVGTPEAGP